ncbi:MAG: ion transporter [Hyphomicrobiales bacterium]
MSADTSPADPNLRQIPPRQEGWRGRLQAIVESRTFQNTITALIVVNAITLGLETNPDIVAAAGPLLSFLDRAVLAIFVVELITKLVVYGRRFPRDPWNIFDLIVVGIAVLPATGSLSVLRALRILRVLRLVSAVPSMRRVVSALLVAIPGMGSIVALLCLIFYVFSVMATKLFGAGFPEWFGSIWASGYSLFQIMTLESWSMGIVRPVMEVYPHAWAFFLPFILTTSFTVLNLFIGIVVDAMQQEHAAEQEELMRREGEIAEQGRSDRALILAELAALRADIHTLQKGS